MIILVLLFTVIISSLIESLFIPKQLIKRPIKAWILHIIVLGTLFTFFLLLLQRPFHALLFTVTLFSLFIFVSYTKYKILKESLVFSDIAMFSQALRFPRLYFPFLGVKGLISLITIPIIILFSLSLEPPILIHSLIYFLSFASGIFILIIIKYLSLTLMMTNNPNEDNKKNGLISTLLAYYYQSNREENKTKIRIHLNQSPFNSSRTIKAKDDIITVQSESFFDPRKLYNEINPNILNQFDKACNSSVQYGRLDVPAWGANTLRSEFSFLSGVNNTKLGMYCYYPYYYLKHFTLHTIASQLKSQGYHCVCIHPYHQDFFQRRQIYPIMGFDEFIDINFFSPNDTVGPYISDSAISDKIIDYLQNRPTRAIHQPIFIFAITMENHGPLHLEKVSKQELSFGLNHPFYQSPLKHSDNDLTVYLRHLNNADKMIHAITDYLSKTKRPSTLCFYGDHVPSLPANYTKLNYNDRRTEYFIWKNHQQNVSPRQQALAIDELAKQLIR